MYSDAKNLLILNICAQRLRSVEFFSQWLSTVLSARYSRCLTDWLSADRVLSQSNAVISLVYVRPSADTNVLTISNRGFIIQLFLITRLGKQSLKKINKYEKNAWNQYALSHLNLHIARACLENVPPRMFWAIADIYPDLVARRHVQLRLMGNFGLKGGIPWLAETDGSLCFTCREDNEILCHFFFNCPTFKPNFDSHCCNLLLKASNLNATDGTEISQFITNLDRFHKTLLLLGCLSLPFDSTTVTTINRFIASAIAKIIKFERKSCVSWRLRGCLSSFIQSN